MLPSIVLLPGALWARRPSERAALDAGPGGDRGTPARSVGLGSLPEAGRGTSSSSPRGAMGLWTRVRVGGCSTWQRGAATRLCRRFCEVTGVGSVPAPPEDGRKRTAARGCRIDFREGDAGSLPFPDSSFESVRHRGDVRPQPGEGRGRVLACLPSGGQARPTGRPIASSAGSPGP